MNFPFLRAALAGVLLFLLSGSWSLAQENLLRNSSLEVDPSSGALIGWKVAPKETNLENSTTEVPEGAERSLEVTVGGVSEGHGQIAQRIKAPAGEQSQITVSGWLRSEISGGAYIQVKLYKGSAEFKRLDVGYSGGSTWKNVAMVVDIEGAETVEILCRWLQQDRNMGKKVGFAKIAVFSGAASSL